MFREMRRSKQALQQPQIDAVLHKATAGVLALAGDDDYPYAVPISYVYDAGKLYFHCAKAGHKLDAIRRNPKASFCVIDQDQIVPAEYTTYFRSVIAFGRIRVLEDAQQKRAAIERLTCKYAPQSDAADRNAAIDKEWQALCVLEMCIDHVTGKEAIELVKKRPHTQG